MTISRRVRELFTYIPAAILPALIIPTTFYFPGKVEWLLGKERFLVILLSVAFAFIYRNTFFVIVFGLTVLYLLTSL